MSYHRRRPTQAEKASALALFRPIAPAPHPRPRGAIAEAIRDAERCPSYYDNRGRCDGLNGCDECLELAAQAVLDALEGM